MSDESRPDDLTAPTERHLAGRAGSDATARRDHDRPPVAVVLFDADGVLQLPRAGWRDRMTALGGDDSFVPDAFAAELTALSGRADLEPLLAELLRVRGSTATTADVFEVWHDIVVDEPSLEVVRRVRAAGCRTALATNQQSYRGSHMQRTLGFESLFDEAFYSFEVGFAKPDPAFFAAIAERLGVAPDQIFFVDDVLANVEGARAAGLRGAVLSGGPDAVALEALLTAAGVHC